MPFATIDELLAAMDTSAQIFAPAKYGVTNSTNVGFWSSSWLMTGSYRPPANPPTTPGAVCNLSTVGAVPFTPAGVGEALHLARVAFSPNLACGLTIMDRLVHVGGFVGNVNTAQTVNSVSIPARAGTGDGVEIWLEWATTTGATPANVTATYTNSEGTTGRVTPATALPATVRGNAAFRLPLQTGDVGARSVESVTLSVSTGTAGLFSVVLMKRIVSIPNSVANATAGSGPLSLGVPVIDNDACLFFINPAASSATPTFDAELMFINGTA